MWVTIHLYRSKIMFSFPSFDHLVPASCPSTRPTWRPVSWSETHSSSIHLLKMRASRSVWRSASFMLLFERMTQVFEGARRTESMRVWGRRLQGIYEGRLRRSCLISQVATCTSPGASSKAGSETACWRWMQADLLGLNLGQQKSFCYVLYLNIHGQSLLQFFFTFLYIYCIINGTKN